MRFSFYLANRVDTVKSESVTKKMIQIAVAAIAISMAVMIVSTSVIIGFKNTITEKVFGFWGHVQITSPSISSINESVPIDRHHVSFGEIPLGQLIEFEDVTREGRLVNYQTSGTVEAIYPFVHAPGIISTEDEIEGIILKGISETYTEAKLNDFLQEGAFTQFPDSSFSRDIVISRQTADRINKGVGDPIILNFILDKQPIRRRFQISGIYKTGIEEYDKVFAITDIRAAQNALRWKLDQVSGYEVFITDIPDAPLISAFLNKDILPPQYFALSIRDKLPSIFDWLELQNTNERLVWLLMLLVAIINIIITLLILTFEKIRLIGVLKSLGAHNRVISELFIFMAVKIVLKGLLIGNAIGILLCLLQQRFAIIKLDEANYYVSEAPIEFNIPILLLLNVIALVVVVASTLLPTLVISRINPVKALAMH